MEEIYLKRVLSTLDANNSLLTSLIQEYWGFKIERFRNKFTAQNYCKAKLYLQHRFKNRPVINEKFEFWDFKIKNFAVEVRLNEQRLHLLISPIKSPKEKHSYYVDGVWLSRNRTRHHLKKDNNSNYIDDKDLENYPSISANKKNIADKLANDTCKLLSVPTGQDDYSDEWWRAFWQKLKIHNERVIEDKIGMSYEEHRSYFNTCFRKYHTPNFETSDPLVVAGINYNSLRKKTVKVFCSFLKALLTPIAVKNKYYNINGEVTNPYMLNKYRNYEQINIELNSNFNIE